MNGLTIRSAAARSIQRRTDQQGHVLPRPKFVFIDGRTGATMYSESYREEILYNAQQNTPALSSYFRADGPPGPELPQRAQQPEDPRHQSVAEIDGTAEPLLRFRARLCTAPLHRCRLCTQSFRPAAIRSR